MCRNLFRDLVTLEHVLEGLDLETKLISKIDQHQDLARDVAVRVNVAFAFEDLDERLELQISSWRNQVLVLVLSGTRAILIPRLFVIARACKCIANHFFNTHARVWITTSDARLVGSARSLYIFAERKLYPRHCSRKKKLTRRPSILDLHNCIEPANRI